jgi:hypothetical protein|tara:strand:- start:9 stop:170 length:162 start_codon:yes stop_codon:yes gene_type:complete
MMESFTGTEIKNKHPYELIIGPLLVDLLYLFSIDYLKKEYSNEDSPTIVGLLS